MRYILLMVVMILSLDAMEKGVVVSEKDSNGVHLSLVKVNAEVLPNFGKEDKYDGTKSLVFYKLDGTTGLSKSTYKTVPHEYNRHVTVYYVEKNNEKNKHAYTIFFNRNDVLFEKQEEVDISNDNRVNTSEEILERGKGNHAISEIFKGGGIYTLLFFFFMVLNGFFINSTIHIMLNKKVNYALQVILILMFLFGGEHIIRTENSNCYDSPYVTEGKVVYFFDAPYVKFIDCYGHESKSKFEHHELLGKTKNESVQIYYNHDTRDYSHNEDLNLYRVYTSESAYEKRETSIRFYFGLLMLFIFVYSYTNKEKELFIPSFSRLQKSKRYSYKHERKYFSKLLEIVDREYYSLGVLEDYFVDPVVSTKKDNKIVIERFKPLYMLLSGIPGIGFLWASFSIIQHVDNTAALISDTIMIYAFGLIGILFLYITIRNFMSSKKVGLFDMYYKSYVLYLEDKTVPFSDIYGYTITYKKVWDFEREYRIELYELDMVLNSGEIVNLYARKLNYEKLLEEAKIIASYTDKPIYDFGKRDINKIFKNKAYVSDGRD